MKVHYWLVLRDEDKSVREKIPEIPSDTDNKPNVTITSDTSEMEVVDEPDEFEMYFNYFIDQLGEANKSNEFLLMMNSGSCKGDVLDDLNKKVEKLAENKNVNFLDLTQPFYESYKKNGKHVCTSFMDPHWNELGHNAAAHAIYRYINEHGILAD